MSPYRFYLIVEHGHYTFRKDAEIAREFKMRKEEYQECMIGLGGFRGGDGEVYFKTRKQIDLVLDWIDSVRVLNILAGDDDELKLKNGWAINETIGAGYILNRGNA
jgi:hypothetical protein